LNLSPSIIKIVLCAAAFLLHAGVVMKMSPTADERDHYLYGMRVISGDTSRVRQQDDSKMPVSALNAAAGMASRGWERLVEPLHAARMVTVLFSLGLMMLTARWSEELYGPAAGVLACVLYALSPQMLAHGTLITTDLYQALAVVAVAYTHWRWARSWSAKRGVAAGLVWECRCWPSTVAFCCFP